MSGQTQQNRFNWIDQVKGLAILAIVIFHFFQNYPDRIPLVSILDRNGAKLGYAAVDIFFVMAGLNTSYALISKLGKNGLEKAKFNWQSWLQKRIYRIYPAYILAVISSCSLYYFFGSFRIKPLIYNLLSFVGLAGMNFQAFNPGFWFFTVILEAYLLTPFIFLISKNKANKILTIGLVIATITKILAFYFLILKNRDYYIFFLQTNFIGSYIFQFCLGLYWGFIYAEYKNFRKIDVILVTTTFLAGLFFYIFLEIKKVDIVYMLGFDIVFTPFIFLGMKELLSRLDKIALATSLLSFISLLGIYSYQIYLIHQPLYFVLLPKLNKVLGLNSYLKIGVSLIITSLVLSVYVILFTKMEKLVMKLVEKYLNQSKVEKV